MRFLKGSNYNAKLISVWVGGSTIETSCHFNEKTNTVSGIDPSDPHLFDAMIDEYIIFKDTIIKQFKFI
jgi:hypothetical protein